MVEERSEEGVALELDLRVESFMVVS